MQNIKMLRNSLHCIEERDFTYQIGKMDVHLETKRNFSI
ncbi:hypothetical protein Patl1_32367 [Pistacia atlantica]|uniref:Uncharacterized protein n=1 Tax=Pistacia atlantica TaxID=434234 RepID=A0ACC1ALQ8_9ROSI|nr:hypothetical protein Patl1_32367 [Pistacia atlantica]